MLEGVADIITLPAIVLLVCLGVLLFSWAFFLILNNSANNEMQNEVVRFADAMNAYASNNGGFSNKGGGSFSGYVTEYINAKPLKNPCYVEISPISDTGSEGSPIIKFWVLQDSSKRTFLSINGQVDTQAKQGFNYGVHSGAGGVLAEGQSYQIKCIPLYRKLDAGIRNGNGGLSGDEGTHTELPQNVNENAPVAGTLYKGLNGNKDFYQAGRPVVVQGTVTTYTKRSGKDDIF